MCLRLSKLQTKNIRGNFVMMELLMLNIQLELQNILMNSKNQKTPAWFIWRLFCMIQLKIPTHHTVSLTICLAEKLQVWLWNFQQQSLHLFVWKVEKLNICQRKWQTWQTMHCSLSFVTDMTIFVHLMVALQRKEKKPFMKQKLFLIICWKTENLQEAKKMLFQKS